MAKACDLFRAIRQALGETPSRRRSKRPSRIYAYLAQDILDKLSHSHIDTRRCRMTTFVAAIEEADVDVEPEPYARQAIKLPLSTPQRGQVDAIKPSAAI